AFQHVQAVQVGQAEIQDHERDAGVREAPERVPAGLRPFDGIAMGAEPFVEERRDALFVLDDQKLHRGIVTQNVTPCPGRLATPASPPWALAIPRTMESPNPVPPRDDPVLNGSKTTCSSPGGSPPPSSATSKRQLDGPACTRRHTGPSPLAW